MAYIPTVNPFRVYFFLQNYELSISYWERLRGIWEESRVIEKVYLTEVLKGNIIEGNWEEEFRKIKLNSEELRWTAWSQIWIARCCITYILLRKYELKNQIKMHNVFTFIMFLKNVLYICCFIVPTILHPLILVIGTYSLHTQTYEK